MFFFRAIALGVLLAGLLPTGVLADDSEWSHRYPPPVKVAPLIRPDVRQASHLDETSMTNHPEWVGDQVQPIPQPDEYRDDSFLSWRPPPHRTIEAPSVKKTSQRQLPPSSEFVVSGNGPVGVDHVPHTGHSNYSTAGHSRAAQGHSVHGNSLHGHSVHGPLLPPLPGVENDPGSVGPGRLGLGTHWIKQYPQPRPPIPNAVVAPRWKSPYSYGHFGAEGKRQWTRQHGYRDRYLQWTLR